MDKKVLAICWLNGRLKAMSVIKGEVKTIWESPQPVDENADLNAVFKEVINQTGYDGVKVSILISSRKLMYHLIEVPPVSGPDLEYYVERKANQLKAFDDPVAFCYRKTPPTRVSNGLLVNIYPRPFLEKIASAFRDHDLHLSRMFTMQTVMQTRLSSLKISSEEVVALAADVEGTTALLIGRKDGEIYFGRTIYGDWKVDPEYVGTEIMRSILFVKQQFGPMASRIFIYGVEIEKWKKPLEQITGLPVEACQSPSTPIDWLKESLNIPEDVTDNLITPDLRQEPQARLFIRMAGFLAIIIIAAIGAWIGFVEKEIKNRENTYTSLQPLFKKLQETQKEIEQRKTEFEHRQQFVKLVTDNITHPVPGWFFGYLCDVFPEDLVLKELHIHWTNGLWHVRIVGVVQPVETNKPLDQALAFGLQLLQNRLERSPFHFKVIGKSETPNLASLQSSSTNQVSDISKDISGGLAARRQVGVGMLGDDLTNASSKPAVPGFLEKVKSQERANFWIEGVMQ